MKVFDTKLADVKVFEPSVFKDERGFFYESFNQRRFEEAIGQSVTFVQDNHSKSSKGVLRGLHYQLPPKAQGKLVRVIQGEIFDVAVDIRKSSPEFGQWVGEILNTENRKQMWIPIGFAHGFVALSETAECVYKTSNYFDPKYEREISYTDPSLKISWPQCVDYLLSPRDSAAKEVQFVETFD